VTCETTPELQPGYTGRYTFGEALMPYVYRCRRCRASSPPGLRRDAEAYRQQHRDEEHGGLVPDGESIDRVAGSTPDPDGRYVSTRAIVALLVVLAVASFFLRLTGS
jgi:hypothetical protein